MSSIMNIAGSALNSFGTGMLAIASNVANVNTDGFQADCVRYQDAPYNNGVQVGAITKETTPGAQAYDGVDATLAAEAAAAAAALERAELARSAESRELSNVQLEREFTSLIAHEHAYTANSKLVRAYDDMMGTVVDMVV